ncbi:MAG: NADH-quinone oxidoreductase subunit A [Candidatus Poribacteria bacterium]|nr:NADH-quinone oxidoreductase subunit A [Candidatus Poribacteria bacterium]
MPAADTYFPILLLFVIAVVLAGVILLIARLITRFAIKPREGEAKYTVYESGVNPLGDARLRFSIKFYLVAMIFIIFDIEVVFFYPWAVVFRDMVKESPLILWEMLVFVAILALGYAYVWRKGGLDWD